MRTWKLLTISSCLLTGLLITFCGVAATRRPHIVFILADDLGFNDVGFHGSNQIPTPNIDILAYSGLILNNYYVAPICTPSRSALMTGKHPVHLGTQHSVLYGAEPRGLSLSETLMPQYLKKLGYATHIVGKWHLGSWKLAYTPTFRGFDSHLGFWTGHQDYNDHTAMEKGTWGLDMRRNAEVAYDLHGQYTTTVITNECVRIIQNHNSSTPLFLYVPHAAVHSGNPYNPLPAPDCDVAKFANITDYSRRRYAGMLNELDKSVGEVVSALSNAKMLNDTIIIFSTDNGGPAAGFNLNAASNFPLRGVKNTLWEGGVRGAGFLWSTRLRNPKRVSKCMMHITDWLPTLYTAAGGDSETTFDGIDGMDLWGTLSEDEESPRNEILHNLDDIEGYAALTKGKWKIVKGTSYKGQWDYWYGPSGRHGSYDIRNIESSKAAVALQKLGRIASEKEMLELRSEATINCNEEDIDGDCQPLINDCLFNIEDDPCERQNLADKYPSMLEKLRRRLEAWNETAIPPANLPTDSTGDPRHWGYVWTNFGDYARNEMLMLNNEIETMINGFD